MRSLSSGLYGVSPDQWTLSHNIKLLLLSRPDEILIDNSCKIWWTPNAKGNWWVNEVDTPTFYAWKVLVRCGGIFILFRYVNSGILCVGTYVERSKYHKDSRKYSKKLNTVVENGDIFWSQIEDYDSKIVEVEIGGLREGYNRNRSQMINSMAITSTHHCLREYHLLPYQ